MDTNYQLLLKHITEAIEGEINLGIQYGGLARLCTPWLLGRTRDNRHVLHVYQFGGMTKDGMVADPSAGVWRWLYLDKFEGLSAGRGPVWPQQLEAFGKSEAPFKAPDFIAEVIAMRER